MWKLVSSFLLVKALDLNFPYECSDYICESFDIDNGNCDVSCMIPPCNYDSDDSFSDTWAKRFLESGCFSSCMNTGCDHNKLGDSTCDESCNSIECGFDLGDCGYCAPDCTKSMLENSSCDQACNTRECMFDNNSCGWCSEGCYLADLTSSTCKNECDNSDCDYQNYICTTSFCADGCSPEMQTDTTCDEVCNNEACNYDNWSCSCSIGCTDAYLDDTICHTECDNEDCKYQNGICGDCASGCFYSMKGDYICDEECNNENCKYDWGDCGCAPGCSSLFDYDAGVWTWDIDICKKDCLVEDCLFNYHVCSNAFYIRSAWFQQVINEDYSSILDFTDCSTDYECSESELDTIDITGICSPGCDSSTCYYCMGLSTLSSSCTRTDGDNCLLCSTTSKQIYNYCLDGDCPPGFAVIPELTSKFLNVQVCLRVPERNSGSNFYYIYVDNEGNSNGLGTEADPMNSLAKALQVVTRKYTKIILNSGVHVFKKETATNELINDLYSPLDTAVNLQLEELWIQGSDKSNKPTIQLNTDLMVLYTQAKKLYIKDLKIDGKYSLKSDCSFDTCKYCPYYTASGDLYVNDKFEFIDDTTKYADNCNDFQDSNFITIPSGSSLYMENVEIKNFQQQFNSFIYAEGSVYLEDVEFDKIQASSSGAFVYMVKSDQDVNFEFKEGKVKNLNYGYEYRIDIFQSGFFKGIDVKSFVLDNVEFEYNFVLSGISESSYEYLIFIQDFTGTVAITSCTFTDSFVNGIIYLDTTSLTYDTYTVDHFNVIDQYSETHLSILNTDFDTISSLSCIICFNMQTIIQNIEITNTTFTNIVASGYGVLFVSNTGSFDTEEVKGSWTWMTINSLSQEYFISPRYYTVENLVFTNIYLSGDLIKATQYPNIINKNTSISYISDMSYDDINTKIYPALISNTYVSNEILDGQITISTCDHAIYIDTSYEAEILDIFIQDVKCSKGYVMKIIECDEMEIYGITIKDLTETSSYEAFYMEKNGLVEIADVYLENIYRTNPSLFVIEYSDSVILESIIGYNLESSYRSVFYLDSVVKIVISSINCTNCVSQQGNGGALYIIPATEESLISITNFICTGCSANSGYGGGIYVDSYSINLKHSFKLSYSVFTSCSAADGAAIYISDRVSFSDALISNTDITRSTSMQGGIITDKHKSGVLNIKEYTSSLNTAYITGLKGVYSYSTLVLNIEKMTIKDSEAIDSSLCLSSLNSETIAHITNFKVLGSSAPSIDATKMVLDISNFYTDSGQGFKLSTETQLEGTDLTFSYLSGYAISASYSCVINIKNSDFEHISSGPALIISNNCVFTITDSNFFNISSTSPGIALYMSLCKGQNAFENCQFSSCSSTTGSLIEIQESLLSLNDCVIKDNESGAMTPGISLISSELVVNKTSFKDQSGAMGSFLYLSTYSDVEINECTFENGEATSGGAISAIMSSVNMNYCTFTSNKASQNGGALYGITSSNFTIFSTSFINNSADKSGSSIYFSGESLEILHSSLSAETSNTYIIELTSIELFLFKYSSLQGYDSPGIYSSYSTSFSVNDSDFSNLQGALHLISSEVIEWAHKINNCTFKNNQNTQGGALFSSDVSIYIIDSTFSDNSADYGGGLYFSCPSLSCIFTIKNTNFISNSATYEGGALKWNDKKPTMENINYTNNTAAYGGNTASLPAKLSSKSSRYLLDSFYCVPGNMCNETLVISLEDSSGNVMTLDSTSFATLSSESSEHSVSGTTKVTADAGVFTFTNFTISGSPGSYMNLSVSTSTIDPSKGEEVGDDVKYENSLSFLVYLRECAIGEQESTTACRECSGQTYLINPAAACLSCPTGATCPGGWKIFPESGYWKAEAMATTIYSCPISSSCLGSENETNYIGLCATGYIGNKCYACDDGYSRSGDNKCGSCPTTIANAFILFILIVFFIIVGIVLVRSTLKSAYSPKALHSIYIKIFTNYLQLVFLTSQFELKWPSYVLKLFTVQKSVATASDRIYSLDCYFANTGQSYEGTFYTKLLITVMLPMIIWTFAFILWVGICMYKKSWRYLKKQYFTTMIVLFFLVYPNIVQVLFSVFSCTIIKGKGYWMSGNLAIKCWEGGHLKYGLTISLPGIIVWALGVPTIVLIIISKRYRHLSSDTNKVIFGFIYNGYKQSRFFWEFVILYRKILIICVAVFMTELVESLQALTLVIILLVSLYLQYEFKPYNKNHLNHMEVEAILTATVTIYCGMYYLTNEIDEAFKTILFIFIAFGNLYFVLYWLYFMFQAVIDLLSVFLPAIRKIRGKIDPYPQYVNTNKLIREGVYKDEEEGILKFTMIKKPRDNIITRLEIPGVKNMKDLYLEVLKKLSRKKEIIYEVSEENLGSNNNNSPDEIFIESERKYDNEDDN